MDLKFENILVNFDQVTMKITDLCIADFGLSSSVDEVHKVSNILGTLPFIAPEMILSQQVNEKVDSWALGIILYMILTC